jgi:membrane protease YdiL (CAAX protease family)
MATGTSSSDNHNRNHLQSILTSIGLRTKNPLLEFLIGFSSISIVVAVLVVFLGKPSMQPIEHLLQRSSLWPTILLAFLGVMAQTIVLPGMLLAGVEQLINTRAALVLTALVFGFMFKVSVFGNYFDWLFTIGVGLTGLFFGLIFVVSRSLWVILGVRAVPNILDVSIKDLENIFYESQRILEQSKPPSTSLGTTLVSGPSFDGNLPSYIWLAMNATSVLLIIFLVLRKRETSSKLP